MPQLGFNILHYFHSSAWWNAFAAHRLVPFLCGCRQSSGIVAVGDNVNVLRVRQNNQKSAGQESESSITEPQGSGYLSSLFWIVLGPLGAIALFWFLNGSMLLK